jgi:hypothetical protein
MKMSKDVPDKNRRRFVQIGLIGLAALPVGGALLQRTGLAAEELPKLDENDPTAQSLGYVHDASKADVSKFPKRAGPDGANQFCHNCQFYSGTANQEWGPCALFPGKLVNANGWCNAWAKKAG